MTFQHSVFFASLQAAMSAQGRISRLLAPEAMSQATDEESGLIELRFVTRHKLDQREQRDVVRDASTYALNGDQG